MTTRHWGRLYLFAFTVLLVSAWAAPTASASTLAGRVDRWSPHGTAPATGWTTVIASKNLGSGTGHDWGTPKKYRARNGRTLFSRQSDSGAAVALSRNDFFSVLGDYRSYVSLEWMWQGSKDHRYRYIISITAIRAGG